MEKDVYAQSNRLAWIFSNHTRWLKICVPTILIIVMGLYYNNNLIHIVNSHEYLKNLQNRRDPFQLCLKYKSIHAENGKYYLYPIFIS